MSPMMDKDLLRRIPRENIPEPSPLRMQEAVKAAQQKYERAPVVFPARPIKRGRAFFGRTWMEAILGAGLVSTASVLAFVLSPAFMVAPPVDEPRMAEPPIRTGMVSRQPETQLDLDLVTELEPYTFGKLNLGVRNAADRFAIYSVTERGVEQKLIEGRKNAAEMVSLSDALSVGWGGREVLAIRSGVGDLQRWDGYIGDGFGYELSATVSRLIWDATDAADVELRLTTMSAD